MHVPCTWTAAPSPNAQLATCNTQHATQRPQYVFNAENIYDEATHNTGPTGLDGVYTLTNEHVTVPGNAPTAEVRLPGGAERGVYRQNVGDAPNGRGNLQVGRWWWWW